MKPIIKAENLTVVYDLGKPSETIALEDINVEIYPEEYVVFFGPSGCGKSTLLYSIAGIERPTVGKIYVKDIDIIALSLKKLAVFVRRNIGFIFQAYNLIPTLSVIENVYLPQIFEGQYKFSRLSKAKKLLERFGIVSKASVLPQELSGGQQQRVGIARALINNPSIILADEPVGNLDSKSAENVLEILMELNTKDKKTIVLVTHEQKYLSFAHRVFYMKDGQIVKVAENPKRLISTKEAKDIKAEISPEELSIISGFYPELSEEEVKSKTLTKYILKEYEDEHEKRLEELVAKRLGEKIETNEFIHSLHLPFEFGGAGLEINQARELAKKINLNLQETESLKRKIRMETGEPMKARAERIRQYLLEDYKQPLSLPQIQRLDELIEKRLHEIINKEQFSQNLYVGIASGGIGFDYGKASVVSVKMESLLKDKNIEESLKLNQEI